MHTTLDAAKKTAEKLRQSGTKFYILELPVLLLAGQDEALLITQINSKITLAHYHPDGASKYRNFEEPKECNIDSGSSLYAAYQTFSPHSDYWDVKPPLLDSVVRFVVNRDKSDLEPYDVGEAHIYTSNSNGPNYYLGWLKKKDNDRSGHIGQILSCS